MPRKDTEQTLSMKLEAWAHPCAVATLLPIAVTHQLRRRDNDPIKSKLMNQVTEIRQSIVVLYISVAVNGALAGRRIVLMILGCLPNSQYSFIPLIQGVH